MDLQSLFRELTPHRLALDMGLPVQDSPEGLFCIHPRLPGTRLFLRSGSVVSDQVSCPFLAGSTFDFLAFHFQDDYATAVKHVFEFYPNLAGNMAGFSLEACLPGFVESLKASRSQFTSLLALRSNLMKEGSRYSPAFVWLRRAGVNADFVRNMIYTATGTELEVLISRHWPQAIVPELLAKEIYLVFPYFSDFHTPAILKIQRATKEESLHTVILHPVQHALFGLHTCLPGIQDVRVFKNLSLAAGSHSRLLDLKNGSAGALHVYSGSASDDPGITLPRATFMLYGGEDFQLMVTSRMVFGDFRLADWNRALVNTGALETSSWPDYVNGEFKKLRLPGKQISLPLITFLNQLKLDKVMFDQLRRQINVKNLENQALLHQWEHLTSIQEAPVFGNLQIIETPAGLVARKIGTKIDRLFTNFSIKVDHKIWFEHAQEMFHSGRVIINRTSCPICFSHVSAGKPVDLENIAINAVMKHLGPTSGLMPLILDTTLRARLSSFVSHQLGSTPQLVGVDRLGWNAARTRFQTPIWKADTLAITETSRIVYPQSDVLNRYYSFREPRAVKKEIEISSEVRQFMALMAAMLARSYLKQACPTINVLRNFESAQLLYALFHPLGQKEAIDLNPNRRGVDKELEKCLSGYPVFISGTDPTIINELELPAFYLHDSGLPFHEPANQEKFHQWLLTAQEIVTKTTMGLLREGVACSNLLETGMPTVSSLVIEGCRAIARYCQLEQFYTADPRLHNFYGLLAEVAFKDLGNYFQFDLAAQVVRLNFRNIRNFRRRDICQELEALDPAAVMEGERHISAPADFLLDLMTKFYGKPVQLFEAASTRTVPAEPTESSSQTATS